MNPVIDFSWYWYVGRAKLGLSFKETGRLTLRMFNKLYEHYKNDFDIEMRLKNANVTYADAFRKQREKEDWF